MMDRLLGELERWEQIPAKPGHMLAVLGSGTTQEVRVVAGAFDDVLLQPVSPDADPDLRTPPRPGHPTRQ